MPLEVTRRKGSRIWHVTGTVAGKRIRESTRTADRRLADEYKADREAQLFRGAVYGEDAVATWAQAVADYTERTPLNPYAARQLLRITNILARDLLRDIKQSRLEEVIKALCPPGMAPTTINRHVVTPIRAVLNDAAVRGKCAPPVFETVKDPTGKLDKRRMRWLRPAEFLTLLAHAGEHLKALLTFGICTGARLGEMLTLEWPDVDLRAARVVLRDTKNGGDRVIDDLAPAAVAALAALTYPRKIEDEAGRLRKAWVVEREGRVFRTDAGLPYGDSEKEQTGQIKTAWAGMCRRAGFPGTWHVGEKGHRWWTPKDVTPHVLRHTWATWHHAVHRDLLKLTHDGDWSTSAMAERYAKVCPSYEVPAILAIWAGVQRKGRDLEELRQAAALTLRAAGFSAEDVAAVTGLSGVPIVVEGDAVKVTPETQPPRLSVVTS